MSTYYNNRPPVLWSQDVDQAGSSALALRTLTGADGVGMVGAKPCAVTRKDTDTLLAFRPLGGPFWAEHQFSNGGGSGPYSWNQTRVVALFSVQLVTAGSYTGAGWVDLFSQDPKRYLGGLATQNSTNADYVEFTFDMGGDLYVIFTGRTSGGYLRVDIDGSTDLANALPSNGTYRYVDTYTASDLQFRQRMKVATGLPYATHTIRLTVTNAHNPSSSGYLCQLEGLGASGPEIGLPSQPSTRPPTWTEGAVYAQYDQVQYLGRNYSADGAGTAGATPPTHTTGSVSDGGVTWLYMASSSYDVASHVIHAAGSQTEYAYLVRPTGASTYQDVGGLVHGNEALGSISVDVDGAAIGPSGITDPEIGMWLSGDSIAITQAITTSHSQLPGTNVADVALTHWIKPSSVTVEHRHVWNVASSVGYFYAAMWPLLAYEAGSQRYTLDWLWSENGGGRRLASDYRGDGTNPIVGRARDYVILGGGDILGPYGSGGVPSASPGLGSVVVGLYVTPNSLAYFNDAATYYAGMAMNMSGADPTANGYSSHPIKMYFERVSGGAPVSVAAGEVWHCQATYMMRLFPSATYDPLAEA